MLLLVVSFVIMSKLGSSIDTISSYTKDDSQVRSINFCLFVVLDDAGMALDDLKKFEKFPGAYTVAIIPRLPESRNIASYLDKRNVPYIIHLPMESMSNENAGEYVINVGNTDKKNIELLRYNFSDFENYIGLNNHMGSKATADMHTINVLLKYIPTGIFVLDSRTTKDTILALRARELQIPTIERDVFIDNYRDILYIKNQIKKGIVLAKQKGNAVLIGHSTKEETAQALIEIYDTVIADGGQFLGLDQYWDHMQNSKESYLSN